jgi:predicted dehydrogenase
MATVDCLFNVPDESIKNRLEIYGSAGSLLAEGTVGQTQSGTLEWIPGFSGSYYDAEQQRVEPRAATTFPLPKGNLYRDQIEDFSDAIQQRRSPFVTGRQGLWIQKVLAGCDRSSEQGTLVPLELSV